MLISDTTLPVAEVAGDLRTARWIDLAEGETLTGVVVQLPARGAFAGTRLFVRPDDDEIVSIAAARRGWTALERALVNREVRVGDKITVTFVGWRPTADGERRYRAIRLSVLKRRTVRNGAGR